MTAATLPEACAHPLLLGDHPALDFLNSVMSPTTTLVDFLRDGVALSAWLPQTQVLGPEVVDAVAAWPAAERDRLADEARALRESLRTWLFARAALDPGEFMPGGSLDFLNALLVASPVVASVDTEDGRPVLRQRRDLGQRSGVLAELAARCAELVANTPAEQVRKCENPACTLWFNDAKRGPRRRWCSMAICGNRMKVAAHRSRQRAA